MDIDVRGRYHPAPGFSVDEDGVQAAASQVAASLGDSEPEDTVVGRLTDTRLSARVALAGGALTEAAPGLFRFDLPAVPASVLGAGLEIHRQERGLPLALPGPLRESVSLELTLPEGAELVFAPKPERLDEELGSWQRTVSEDGRTIRVTSDLRLDPRCVAPAGYSRLRELLAAAGAPDGRSLLIRWPPED